MNKNVVAYPNDPNISVSFLIDILIRKGNYANLKMIGCSSNPPELFLLHIVKSKKLERRRSSMEHFKESIQHSQAQRQHASGRWEGSSQLGTGIFLVRSWRWRTGDASFRSGKRQSGPKGIRPRSWSSPSKQKVKGRK